MAPSYNWVLILRAVQGIGASALLPLTIVLISDILPDEQEIQGQGIKVALDRVSMIVLPLIGGALAILSWRAAFVPFVLIVLLAIAAALWMPETGRPGQDSLKQYLARTARAIREPRLTLAFATGFLRFFLDYGLYTYLPILLALRYGASPAISGLLIAASAVGSIITALAINRIYGRVATEKLLALAFFASAIGLGLPALGAPLWLIAIGMLLFGLGNGLISPLQKSLMTRRTPAELRGGVIAVDRVIQQVAKSAAPALLGADAVGRAARSAVLDHDGDERRRNAGADRGRADARPGEGKLVSNERLHAPENQRNRRLSAGSNGAPSHMISSLRRCILVSIMSGLVAACAMSPEKQAQSDEQRCTARGLKPTTKEHDDCVSGLTSSRDARMQQRHRELVERPAPTPFGR